MTLKEMKKIIFRLIEEASVDTTKLTDDEDFGKKINDIINQIMIELTRFKKIPAYIDVEVTEGQEYNLQEEIDDFYQLRKIKGIKDYDLDENLITFNENGNVRIFYYRFPDPIRENTNEEKYTFELTEDLLSAMPYGVAADILKSDVSNNYGQIYANRYKEILQSLDPRYNLGTIVIEGGIDI